MSTWSQAPGAQPRSRTAEPGVITLYCFCIWINCSSHFQFQKRVSIISNATNQFDRSYTRVYFIFSKFDSRQEICLISQTYKKAEEKREGPWTQSGLHNQGAGLLCRRNQVSHSFLLLLFGLGSIEIVENKTKFEETHEVNSSPRSKVWGSSLWNGRSEEAQWIVNDIVQTIEVRGWRKRDSRRHRGRQDTASWLKEKAGLCS